MFLEWYFTRKILNSRNTACDSLLCWRLRATSQILKKKSNQLSRSLYHSYLRLNPNRENSHGLLQIQASKVTYRKKCTIFLVVKWFVMKVYSISKREGVRKELKLDKEKLFQARPVLGCRSESWWRFSRRRRWLIILWKW